MLACFAIAGPSSFGAATALGGLLGGCTSFGTSAPIRSGDGGAPDGGVGDGGADGGDRGVSSIGFCDDKPGVFCDDFERDGDVFGAWTEGGSSSAATLSIDSAFATSGTRSLHLAVGPGQSESSHFLSRPVAPTTQRLTLSFAMRFGAVPSDDIDVAAIAFKGNNKVFVLWSRVANALLLAEQDIREATGTRTESSVIGEPPLGTFVRYTLDVDLGARTATVATDRGDVNAILTFKLSHEEPQFAGLGDIFAYARATTEDIWFDDAVLR